VAAVTPEEAPMANSTFASRREARLVREAVEGVPRRRKLGLNAGQDAEQSFVITVLDEGAGMNAT
jgi:hypothetical protein